jgi:hypothetical protein
MISVGGKHYLPERGREAVRGRKKKNKQGKSNEKKRGLREQ